MVYMFIPSVSLATTPILMMMSDSWLIVWGMLEINNMSFTCLKMGEEELENKNYISSMMKYFLVQSISSSIMIAIIFWSELELKQEFYKFFFMLFLMLKMANSPLHKWFLDVCKSINLGKSMLMMTWQKIMPFSISFINRQTVMWFFIMLNVILIPPEILGCTLTIGIMALSSIFNNSWILSSTQINMTIMIMFILLYWTAVILMMNQMKFYSSVMKNYSSSVIISFLFLFNLSSLPPTSSFLAKWILSVKMIKLGLMLKLSFLLMMSSANVFSYMRMFILKFLEKKSKEKSLIMKHYKITSIASLILFFYL